MLRRNVEFLSAGLARDRVVDTDHVVAELGEQRAIAVVGARRDARLPGPHDPPHLVLVSAPASGTRQMVGTGVVAALEKIALVEGHIESSGSDGQLTIPFTVDWSVNYSIPY